MAKKLKGEMGIVPALDIDSHEHLERVVRETSKREGVAGYKLGLTSVLHFGLGESVRRLRDLTDLPVIYDHQKAGPDMPDMAKKYTALCKEADVDGLILFPVAGPTAVDQFVGESIRADLTPFVGGEIPVPDYGVSGGGYMLDDALDRILVRATQNKCDHFVLPAHDVTKIKRWSKWPIVPYARRARWGLNMVTAWIARMVWCCGKRSSVISLIARRLSLINSFPARRTNGSGFPVWSCYYRTVMRAWGQNIPVRGWSGFSRLRPRIIYKSRNPPRRRRCSICSGGRQCGNGASHW